MNTTVKGIEKLWRTVQNCSPEMDISLEYVLTLLFPMVWDNIQIEMSKQYMSGYTQAKIDLEKKS